MSQYLFTQSLYSAFAYQFKDFSEMTGNIEDPVAAEETAEKYAEKAREDFLRTLRREPSETTEAMARGNSFETLVMLLSEGNRLEDIIHLDPGPKPKTSRGQQEWVKWYEGANKIAGYVRGAAFQVPAYRNITVNGADYLLHGRLDALKDGAIYDIKYASRYEYGNMYNSAQHPMYFALLPEAHAFTYLIYKHGEGVYTEAYRREDARDISYFIIEFMDYLDIQGLMTTYKEKWLSMK